MRRRALLAVTLVIALALASTLGACSKGHGITAPRVVLPTRPEASTPVGAVQLWRWALVKRDTAAYRSCFTDDFVFQFAASDSAGSPYRDDTWGFPREAQSVDHLVAGGGSLPPASAMTIDIDNPLVATADLRPGRDPRWHRAVRTSVNMKITINASGTPNVSSITGYALFYVVRGDSAVLSPARAARGGSDSTRWYIQRWEDETAGATGAPAFHPDPTHNISIGYVKARYLD